MKNILLKKFNLINLLINNFNKFKKNYYENLFKNFKEQNFYKDQINWQNDFLLFCKIKKFYFTNQIFKKFPYYSLDFNDQNIKNKINFNFKIIPEIPLYFTICKNRICINNFNNNVLTYQPGDNFLTFLYKKNFLCPSIDQNNNKIFLPYDSITLSIKPLALTLKVSLKINDDDIYVGILELVEIIENNINLNKIKCRSIRNQIGFIPRQNLYLL